VAHSHGGNVIAETLPAIRATDENPVGITGTVTTLGTPFLDAMSPIARRMDRRRLFLNWIAWCSYIIMLRLWSLFTIGISIDAPTYSLGHYVNFILLLGVISAGLAPPLATRPKAGRMGRVLETIGGPSIPVLSLSQ
jgi:hypothetical protein